MYEEKRYNAITVQLRKDAVFNQIVDIKELVLRKLYLFVCLI